MDAREPSTPPGTVLVAAMAIAVLVGAPLVYLIWEAVNELLTGHVADVAVLPTLVAAFVFTVLLWVLGRSVMRVVGEDDTRIEPRLAGAHPPGRDEGAGPQPPASEAE